MGPYPCACPCPGASGRVHGEVYSIPPTLLRRLDGYEDVPREYIRTRVETRFGAAWIYVYPARPRRGHRLMHGRWTGEIIPSP